MKEKLDQDKAGIILLDDFLTEFYPFPVSIMHTHTLSSPSLSLSLLPKMECEKPKAFTVYHYNGLIYNKEDEVKIPIMCLTYLLSPLSLSFRYNFQEVKRLH